MIAEILHPHPVACAGLAAPGFKPKLLIIDDEPVNVALLEELLEEAGYSDWKSTTDSRRALTLFLEFEPDLILLDLMMPHLDGFTVMEQLASVIPAGAFVPILVLTADATLATKRRVLGAGATDFLTKPFDHVEVSLRVKNLLHARSQHLQLQAQNDTLEERVRERTRELRETQNQIVQQERMQSLGLMASGVAHDINNALSIILGFGELLLGQRERLSDSSGSSIELQTVITAAKDAARMVGRLREFSRPSGVEDKHTIVDLNALVEQAIFLTQPRWKNQVLRSGATIHVASRLQKIPHVIGDAAELREALTNLIFNAVDATPDGGNITLETEAVDGQVVLRVRDTGTGMSEEIRQRCLEPFFTTKGKRGTGLGLAMVYGIVQRHGGTVDIETALGQGTAFTFRFPGISSEHAAEEVSSNITRPLRILVVDDHPILCEITAQHLTSDWHTVEVAANGREALAKFRAEAFDLVITDQAMPEMNGDQLATSVKQLKPATPVIMLTGFGSATGERSGAIDFLLGKPASLTALRQAITKVLA